MHDKNCILFLDPAKLKKWIFINKLIDSYPNLCQYCGKIVEKENQDKKEEK